jgi:surfactin synthase thioesterase subunit
VKYESKKLEREHYLFNIPDQDIDGLNDRIVRDLKAAGVGTRPFLIVSYSMGGVVTRHIILKQLISDTSIMRD